MCVREAREREREREREIERTEEKGEETFERLKEDLPLPQIKTCNKRIKKKSVKLWNGAMDGMVTFGRTSLFCTLLLWSLQGMTFRFYAFSSSSLCMRKLTCFPYFVVRLDLNEGCGLCGVCITCSQFAAFKKTSITVVHTLARLT